MLVVSYNIAHNICAFIWEYIYVYVPESINWEEDTLNSRLIQDKNSIAWGILKDTNMLI